MQQTLPKAKTVDPSKEIKECWRCQASSNVDNHDVLCTVDEIVIETTVEAMINELVDFEAVKAL